MLIHLLSKAFPLIENYKFSFLEGRPFYENSVTFEKKGGMEATGTAGRKYQQLSGSETR
jgi:hypothetical protein